MQDQVPTCRAYSDSDWAGCSRTRKSTSGGTAMMGKHLIVHWSSTQATIALSVAEAELNGMTKGGTESLFLKHLSDEIGLNLDIEIRTDSSAGKGILSRQGCGKVKHLEARQMWLQQKVLDKEVKIVKVPRNDNPSDTCTHYWSNNDGEIHFRMLGINFEFEDKFSALHVKTLKPRGGVESPRYANLFL